MRETQLYLSLTGFTVQNRSLTGRSGPLFPVRLHFPNAVQYIFWGNGLTWAILEPLGIFWGDNETLHYAILEPGWTYEWNLKTRIFTVTNAGGEVTAYEATTLSDLGISWEILESSQFFIYPFGTIGEFFLSGTRIDLERPGESQNAAFMDIDYLRGVQHAVFDFLSACQEQDPHRPDIVSIDNSIENYSDILLASTNEINFTNGYPIDLYPGESTKTTERRQLEHQGYIQTITYLIIRMFASRMLSLLNSKIVFEPWMLWEIFKWVYVRPNSTGKRDKIFDLSPWWG